MARGRKKVNIMPITSGASDYVSLESGNIQRFKGAKMYLYIVVDTDDAVRIEVKAYDSTGDAFYGSRWFEFTTSELDAYTGSGSGEFAPFKNVCEQAVKDALEGISENTGNTFTIV